MECLLVRRVGGTYSSQELILGKLIRLSFGFKIKELTTKRVTQTKGDFVATLCQTNRTTMTQWNLLSVKQAFMYTMAGIVIQELN